MFLIQAGHQSSTHIVEALPDGRRATGVIWSLADETPVNLTARMDAAVEDGAIQAIDPQLYVALLSDANPKRLPDHDLFRVPLPRPRFSARRVSALVEGILQHQIERPGTHLIAPTVAISAMNSRSAQVALNLAETALEVYSDHEDEERPLLVSVALERSVLTDSDGVNLLLDELTALEGAAGFYLLFEIDPGLDSPTQAALLAEAMYVAHTLSLTAGKLVWVGYAGLSGYLFRAAGADAFAAGWFQKQQWWSLGHWGPPGGGRSPRPRIYLDAIIGSLLSEPELANARSQQHDGELGGHLLAGVGALAAAYRAGQSPELDRGACAAQLFDVCVALDGRVSGEIEADLATAISDLDAAAALHARIEAAGVELEGRSTPRQLRAWREAIDLFAERAEIELEED